ncbi:hypothetical protein DL93DRAFT_1116611 [Clavulina sp. PMI_390]|nr:hypothetical protein DL93DRAFT_1116611 [Clavulina sp. PMI_390]
MGRSERHRVARVWRRTRHCARHIGVLSTSERRAVRVGRHDTLLEDVRERNDRGADSPASAWLRIRYGCGSSSTIRSTSYFFGGFTNGIVLFSGVCFFAMAWSVAARFQSTKAVTQLIVLTPGIDGWCLYSCCNCRQVVVTIPSFVLRSR